MQAGLMDTYHRPVRSRKAVAWILCAALVAFYLDQILRRLSPKGDEIKFFGKNSMDKLLGLAPASPGQTYGP